MSQIQISPEQIPVYLAQWKAELTAVEEVLKVKRGIVEEYQTMIQCLADDNVPKALLHFAGIQLAEYDLLIKGFEEKVKGLSHNIAQLESPILTAQAQPMPARGFRPPKIS